MKFLRKKNNSLFYTLGLVFVLALVFVPGDIRETKADIYNHNVLGWIWSENYGWGSLNNLNDINQPNEQDYGLNIQKDPSGNFSTLSGWVWFNWEAVPDQGEWICFGTTCNGVNWGTGGNATPPSGNQADLEIKVSPSEEEGMGSVSEGWARIVSLGQ